MKPELDIVTKIIAKGHAYLEHVLGKVPDSSSKLQGVNMYIVPTIRERKGQEYIGYIGASKSGRFKIRDVV